MLNNLGLTLLALSGLAPVLIVLTVADQVKAFLLGHESRAGIIFLMITLILIPLFHFIDYRLKRNAEILIFTTEPFDHIETNNYSLIGFIIASILSSLIYILPYNMVLVSIGILAIYFVILFALPELNFFWYIDGYRLWVCRNNKGVVRILSHEKPEIEMTVEVTKGLLLTLSRQERLR